MPLRAVLSPPAGDVLDLYAAHAPMKPVEAKAAILMIARSVVEGWYVGAELQAAALFYPLPSVLPGELYCELAFVCRPDFGRHLLPFLRSAQLTRARLALNAPVRVRALVRAGHRPGARLAALCDMVRIGTVGAFEQWEFEGRPDGQFVDGVKSLFSGTDTSAADAAAAKAKEDQNIALSRQQQDVQNQTAQTDEQLGKVGRAPKGRRLLLAATGEAGVSSNLGGT